MVVLAVGSTLVLVVDVSDTLGSVWAPRALSPGTSAPMLCWLVEVEPAVVAVVDGSGATVLDVESLDPVVSVVSVDADESDGGG